MSFHRERRRQQAPIAASSESNEGDEPVTTRTRRPRTGARLPGLLLLATALAASGVAAEENPEEHAGPVPEARRPMDLAGLDRFVTATDPDHVRQHTTWRFVLGERAMVLVADPVADRMRLMTPITGAAGLDAELQYRLLQANFDTALDARYAVAGETLWAAYIHPLSPLDRDRLADAALQVWTAAETFGTTFSSGSLRFRGGDSGEEIRKRREELLEESA